MLPFQMCERAALFASIGFLGLLIIGCGGCARSPARLSAGPPGDSLLNPSTLATALTIRNSGTGDAQNVSATKITLTGGTLTSPAPLPFNLGTIPANGAAVLNADFSGGFAPSSAEVLEVSGTYTAGRASYRFDFTANFTIPKASPGSAPLHYLQVTSKQVSGGGYPPAKTVNENEGETNRGGWTTPIGPVIVGTPSAPTTSITSPPEITASANRLLRNRSSAKLPSVAAGSVPKAATSSVPHKRAAHQLNLPPVVFYRDTDMYAGDFVSPTVPTNGQYCSNGDPIAVCAEPSGAAEPGGTVFTSSNWLNAWSVDGVFESGVNAPEPSFHPVDPTTVFPADIPFCCDQVVQYAPTIDRFIWVMQLWDGHNGSAYRLAVSSPADIATYAGTRWAYWALPASLLTSPFNINIPTMDYPDLSIGNNYVYLSFNVYSDAVEYGHEVARISLASLQAGGTIQIGVTDPADGTMCWGSHLTQDTLDAAFWAGHENSSHLRVFSMKETDNSYSWQDVQNPSYNNNVAGFSSVTPDGRNWMASLKEGNIPRDAVIGATRVLGTPVVTGNAPPPETYDLWFAWTAPPIGKLPNPYIALVEVDQNLKFVASGAIWGSLAYGYPALATNRCTQEVGVSLAAGGNGYYQHHEVGFLDDDVLYATTVNSNVGADRWGDYVTIRQAPLTKLNPGNLFLAFGFGISTSPRPPMPEPTGVRTSVRYVVFGRQECPVIQ